MYIQLAARDVEALRLYHTVIRLRCDTIVQLYDCTTILYYTRL